MRTPKNTCLIKAEKEREVKLSSNIILPPTAKKFNEFQSHVVTQDGIVVAVPTKLRNLKEVEISPGDHVYGHHFMCIDEKAVKINEEILYANDYDSLYCKIADDGAIIMLGSWNFIIPVYEPLRKIKTTSGIILSPQHNERKNLGKVIHLNSELALQGVKKGDIVWFKDDREYEILIKEKMYYRIRNKDILSTVEGLEYVEEKLNLEIK